MNKAIDKMFEIGVFEQRYNGIIEIFPHRVTNSRVFDAALNELSKEYEITKMFDNWLRAFKRK